MTGNFNQVIAERDKHVKIGNENFHFLNGEGQILSGEQVITIVDKGFITDKLFKKLTTGTKYACVQKGKTSTCCIKDGMAAGERVYHVMI